MSYYRGIVIHEGYFNILEKQHDINDILAVLNHLHDILVRIVFKILGYTGTYQPTMVRIATEQEVDWVKSNFSASQLGY